MLKHRHSLRLRMLFFCLFFTVILALLLLYNDYSAISTMQQQSFEAIRDVTNTQCSQLDDTLSSLDIYLAGFVYDSSDVSVLSRNDRSSGTWFSALYRLRKEFDAALTVQDADDFFLYSPGTDLFLTSTSGFSADLQGSLAENINNGIFFTGDSSGHWLLIPANGGQYLVRVLRVRSSYVGAVLDANRVLAEQFGHADTDIYYAFSSADGLLLRSGAPEAALPNYVSDTQLSYVSTRMEGKPCLLLTRPLSRTLLSLAVLIPDQALLATVQVYRRVMLGVLVCIIVMLGAATLLLHRWVTQPVGALTTAIHSLRSGDMEVQVSRAARCTEFDEMNDAFNSMVREIKDLKINVYEEQLRHQDTEIAYLTLQVTPHFLVNCLNTVYQLTDAARPDLVKHMVRDLSQHLRYMLNSGAAVSLADEMAHVSNFVELSGIRYPGCLRLKASVDPAAADCRVIPLLVLNFVENTVKYEAGMGHVTEMHITATRRENTVHIEIWDTGRGFTPEILARLQDVPSFVRFSRGKHIGIANVFQRAQLILGEHCTFAFSNRSDAGAQIDMEIPYVSFSGQEELP